jgi:hygromycin-B 4-O-kinase
MAFLSARYGRGIADVVPIAQQGMWSHAYRFRNGAAELVVRFSPMRENFDRDAFAARHASSPAPIPRILEIGEVFGGWFAVSEHANGHLIDSIDGLEMQRTLPSLFAALDAVRAIDLSRTTGYGYWDANGNGEDLTWEHVLLGGVPRWRAEIAGSVVGLSSFEAGVDRMRTLAPFSPPVRHLVHGDLLHHNVLVADGQVTALLDWGSGFIGDFLYDIAWLTFWQPWYPLWAAIDFAAEARAHYEATGTAVGNFAERLRCYELRIAVGIQAWFATRGERENLERAALRTLELARSS